MKEYNGITFAETGSVSLPDRDSKLWSGEKPPQVTSITYEDAGWLSNGHFGVIIKVMGYGSDITKWDNKRIYNFKQDPIVLYGTGCDGFYYWFDCGTITSAGTYRFESNFTSNEAPYKQKYFYKDFPFS
ncbi:MAG: hypothetical protein LBQ71_05385 [Hungatella sp.]|jgi:hypothetical protein|nr:hypothetical protein [Hungatella sp.]